MKAAHYRGPGEISVDEVPVPSILDDEILLRVRAASVCGTDLRIAKNGHFKIPAGTARVLGHEVAGEIVEVGKRVAGYTVGERVSVPPNVGCGRCNQCRRGENNMCADYEAFGISIDGGFEEYMRIPAIAIARGNVFKLPDHVGYAEAALTEPLSCCYRGQLKLGTSFRDTVLIVGAGPIGAFHVMLSRIAGARKIIVSNAGAARLDAVRQLGADVVVDVLSQDLAEVVMAETDGLGADVIVTAVSSPQVQAEAVRLLATNGRVNFFAGLGKGIAVEIDTNLVHYKGLTLTGTTGSSNADYAAALRLVADRRIDLTTMVSATFPLERISEAFDHSISGAGMKAMVAFE